MILFLKRIASIVLSLSLVVGGAFAQESASQQVCSATPSVVQSYIDFVTSATAILGNHYDEGQVSPLGPFADQFVTENLTLKKANTLTTIYKAHQKRLKENLLFLNNTKKVLMKTIAGTLSSWTRQQVSLYTPELKRDLDKLAALDPMLDNLSLALGRAGLSSQTIHEDTQEELMQLIRAHSPGLLQENSTIAGASYDSVIKLLNRMQSQMKQAIVLNHSDDVINNNRLIISSSSVSLAISDQAQQSLVAGYQAVREQMCNTSVSTTKNAFGEAWQEGVSGVSEATREFVRGWKMLKYFFAGESGTLNTQDEQMIQARLEELERSRRGYKGDSDHIVHFPHANYRNNFKDLLRTRGEDKQKNNEVEDIIDQNTDKKLVSRPSALRDQLADAIYELQEATYTDQVVLQASQSQDITQTVADTAVVIERLQALLDLSEDNLAVTCDLQCNNKGGVCRSQ